MVLVLQQAMKPLRGLCIGSQISAGGAALCAAFLEQQFLKTLRAWVYEEIMARTFVKRWLDDILYVVWAGISKEAEQALRVLRSKHFYGEHLLLEMVDDTEPFGFKLAITNQGIILRSRLAFVGERNNEPGEGFGKERSTLHGGPQFRTMRLDKAVITGHFLRIQDLTNAPESITVASAARMAVELILMGYNRERVAGVMRKLERQGMSSLRPVRPIPKWSEEECRAFVEVFDAVDSLQFVEARLSMLSGFLRSVATD